MSAPPLAADKLVRHLRALCALPASGPATHETKLVANGVAGLLRGLGMRTSVVPTAGAPVVLAQRAGRQAQRTVILYHHYDVAPTGPWRDWSHEPLQLAERDGAVYGRGVADGLGPLAAHIQALHTMLDADGELPCNVVFVVEGEGLSGSAHLDAVLAKHRKMLRADYCVGSGGDTDSEGKPFCYSGSKGLLQIQLTAHGARYALPSGLATSVANPLWRLVWALGKIKGDDEDVRIPGFYDTVDGPSRDENAALRNVKLDEAGRLAAWGAKEFLFGMSGKALVRTEATLPTCNLSALTSEPASNVAYIPASATAQLDFQLVPSQQPDVVLAALRDYLIEQNFADIVVDALPGGYVPHRIPIDHELVRRLVAAGEQVYGAPLRRMPLCPFPQPLHLFATLLNTPTVSLGVTGPASAVRGTDEQVRVEDLVCYGRVLIEFFDHLTHE